MVGFISVDELQKGMANLGENISIQETEELLKMVDKDRDNKISLQDFIWMMTNEPGWTNSMEEKIL